MVSGKSVCPMCGWRSIYDYNFEVEGKDKPRCPHCTVVIYPADENFRPIMPNKLVSHEVYFL